VEYLSNAEPSAAWPQPLAEYIPNPSWKKKGISGLGVFSSTRGIRSKVASGGKGLFLDRFGNLFQKYALETLHPARKTKAAKVKPSIEVF